MTNPAPTPDGATRAEPAASLPRQASRAGVLVATVLGLGRVPVAPGTAGSLAAAVPFAAFYYWLEGAALQFAYLAVLAWLVPLALWGIEVALPHWNRHDPQAIVIDETVGQWLTYGGLVLAGVLGLPLAPGAAGWKSLLAGFILFRVFDVAKPFPIRRSEHLAGAAGVLVDDALAGVYAGAGLLLLVWSGWMR